MDPRDGFESGNEAECRKLKLNKYWKTLSAKYMHKSRECLLAAPLPMQPCEHMPFVSHELLSRNGIKRTWLTMKNCLIYALCLFIASTLRCELVKGSSFQSRLRNVANISPDVRKIRSLKDEDQGMYFDSRIHRSIEDLHPETPDNDTVKIEEVAEILMDYSYDNNSDYQFGLGLPAYGTMEDMVRKVYRGPVCAMVDVRNTPTKLTDLENCTIVNGFVQIIFMHNTKESDFEKYTFPKLRVITEYLLVYRVYGLRSLGKMFPNLAVIKGRQVFDHYGLVVYENPQLQDVGLGNLRYIERGGVRIQKNSKLCYLETVDWKRLGMLGDKVINEDVGKPVIKDNAISEDETCLNQCGEEGECSDASKGTKYCWGHKLCQQPSCPKECPNACENGTCVCHEECLGGCTAPNNSSACLACFNKYHEGVCVPECPEGTFLENEWRCVTREWCLDFTWVPHDGKCLSQCPLHHKYAPDLQGGYYCEFCGRSCIKDCDGSSEYIVSDVQSLKELKSCAKIPGRLSINIVTGDDLLELLEETLALLEEVGSLAIRRSASLISLDFLRNLKRITGEESALIDGTYSLYILDNQNLRELFPSTNTSSNSSVRIGGGKAFFHFNPKLCMKEVDKMRQLTEAIEDDKDISETTNGDRATCDMMPLNIIGISHMPMRDSDFAAVRVKWEKVKIDDPRNLIGYQVFYKESKYTNATRFEGLYACGKSSSSWMVNDHVIGRKKVTMQENSTAAPDAVLHGLRPFTQYALYIRTYTTSSAQKGAQSNITYFRTEPSRPSEPVSLTATAVNATAIHVAWKAPYRPNGNITHYIVKWRRLEEDLQLVRSVDMCKQEKRTYPLKTAISSQTPSIAPSKSTSGDKKRDCCSCDSGKILPSHEEEANNNVNFEDFLHKSIFRTLFLYTAYDYVNDSDRRKRSLEGDSDPSGMNVTWNSNSTDVNHTESDDTTSLPFVATFSTEYYNPYNYEIDVAMDTYITLTGLHHFSEYEIQVLACNHASKQPVNGTSESMGEFAYYEITHGCSLDSLTAKRAERLPSGDDIPPESVRLTEQELNDGRKQPALTWEAPPDPNGYVKSFEIDLQQKQHYEQFKSARQYFCVSINEFEEKRGVYVIPTHVAAGSYQGRVRAVSLAGKGEWTNFTQLEIPDGTEGQQQGEKHVWIVAILAVMMILAISIVTLWCYKRKKKEEARNAMTYSSANPEYISLAANYVPDGYEVDVEDVELVKLIGQGNFGKVFVGFAKKVIKGEERTEVAIKKMHQDSGIHKRIEFLEEAKLMKAFNSTHVVRLLGVVSQNADPMVIMEYMAKGDLKSHLKLRREDAEHDTDDWLPPPRLQERLQMAAEIADGMAYLSEIKFVHRDLAARNCLVSAKGVVKIGDFGLTRDVYETDYYRKDSRGLLPIRWMAPESLRDGVFDSQSDVWAYGVVLWEIATLAEQPYQGQQHDEVTRYVIDGGYMDKPKNCPNKLYDLMLNCWEFNPEMRPKFMEILSSLSYDVTKRFKEESYYFEQKRAKDSEAIAVKDKFSEEHMSLLNGDAFISREGSFRIVTPLDLTPSRSRSGTPCGCHTPASRNSNGSAKTGCEFSPHCGHLKRIDASAFSAVQPLGMSTGLKHSASLNNGVPRRGNGLLRKCETFTHRGLKNPSPRQKKTPPTTLSQRRDDMYYSLSTSGIEDDFDGASSEDSALPQVVATEQIMFGSIARDSPPLQERPATNSSYLTLMNLPPSKTNHVESELPDGPRLGKDIDTDKPYAHMNGFVKRHDSQTNQQRAHRQKGRRTPVEDESSYVESSPQKSSKHFGSGSGFPHNHIDPSTVPPPSPAPPFPPPTHPLLQAQP